MISLAEYADADGLPEASFMLGLGNHTYVAIQNLEDWAPSRTGRILVVENDTDTLLEAIELNSPNPFSPLVRVDDSRFVVGCVGDFSGTSGGIELVTATPGSTSLMVASAEQLGGVPTDFAMQDNNCGFALVNTPDWQNGIRRFCLDSGAGDWLVEPGVHTIVSLFMVDPETLVFADATYGESGLRFVDLAGEPVVSALLTMGLPPGFSKPIAWLP